MSDEVIAVNCAVPGHWVDEVLGGVHDGGLPEDPRTPCRSAAEMDEMVDDGVTGYVPLASLQHWAREAAEARAENARLREALREAAWLAKLARGSSWPGEMAQRVEDAADRVMAAASLSETGGE